MRIILSRESGRLGAGPAVRFRFGGGIVERMAQGRIPHSDIEEIRQRTPIEEVVGEYVQLKPAGVDSMKGLSPFKEEKTPSFHVRPNRGYFHCFSSGEGGDVFSFLMKMEHITFPEAVEWCAERIGYRINYEGGGTGRREHPGTRQRLVAANREAFDFYREHLESSDKDAQVGREFLLQRGFSADHARAFGCGFAPAGWDTLTKHLLRKGFEFEELKAAGLSTMGKRGPIDRFHRRLLWPIRNLAGDVIGFGARKLFDDDKLGKYMNTPDTLLYKKSSVLFGLDMAKKHIASGHQAVVVEGYTDVMAMHAAGVKTAVAACGTAFGAEHLQILRRLMLDDTYFRGEIIYTFDGDEAGEKAALRAFEGDQKFTGQSFVAVAPDSMDPCDVRLKKGDAAVRDLVARRVPMFEFVIRATLRGYHLDSPEGRLSALRRTVPIVAGIRDTTLQTEYARQLAGWVGWSSAQEVVNQVRAAAREAHSGRGQVARRATRMTGDPQPVTGKPPAFALPNPKDPMLWVQRESIKVALQHPRLAGSYFDGLSADCFSDPAYRYVFQSMQAAGGVAEAPDGVAWLSLVSDHMSELLGKTLVSQLACEAIPVEEDQIEAYIDSILSRLQEAHIGNHIAELKSTLERMRPADDQDAYNGVFQDLMALEQARRELLERAFRYHEPH